MDMKPTTAKADCMCHCHHKELCQALSCTHHCRTCEHCMTKPTTTQEQLVAQAKRDLEFILTEWEGKSNPVLGAVRVKSRMDQILPVLTTVIETTRKESEKERVVLRSDLMRAIGFIQGLGHLDPNSHLAKKYLTESGGEK